MTESWRRLYPFESHQVLIDGHRLHYVDEGSGAPLVMVHGNPTWSFYWRNIIGEFRGTHRTLAVDHIGCGLSDKPQDYNYTLQQHIDNLDRWWTELDLHDITVLVHDWGGAIGLGAALKSPHRIARVVIFNTGAFPPPFVPFRIRLCRLPWIGNFAMRRLNLFARAALRMAVEDRRVLTPDIKSGLLAPYDSWQNRIAISRFVQDIPFTSRHPTWQVLEAVENGLGRLRHCPVQIMWGMKDWCFNRTCFDRMREHFPDADVVELETSGHYVVEEAIADIVSHLRRFLDQHPLSSNTPES